MNFIFLFISFSVFCIVFISLINYFLFYFFLFFFIYVTLINLCTPQESMTWSLTEVMVVAISGEGHFQEGSAEEEVVVHQRAAVAADQGAGGAPRRVAGAGVADSGPPPRHCISGSWRDLGGCLPHTICSPNG